jgi:hypothetical protein
MFPPPTEWSRLALVVSGVPFLTKPSASSRTHPRQSMSKPRACQDVCVFITAGPSTKVKIPVTASAMTTGAKKARRSAKPLLLALLLVMAAGQAQTMPLDTASQGSAPPPPQQQQQQACGSCYGAEDPSTGRQCCNSCSDVRTAYTAKAWTWPGEQRCMRQ